MTRLTTIKPSGTVGLMGYQGNIVQNAGYFYAPYVPLTTSETSVMPRTHLCLRRYRPWGLLPQYVLGETYPVISSHQSRICQQRWWAYWLPRWHLELGDERALPDPDIECAVQLSLRGAQYSWWRVAPAELWLWRDKYWVDTLWLNKHGLGTNPCREVELDHVSYIRVRKGILTRYSKKLLAQGKQYYGKITLNDI